MDMTVSYGAGAGLATADAETRRASIDALQRFAWGQDLRDRTLFESAFAEDAVLDFSQPARRFGVTMPPLTTRSGIAAAVFTNLAGIVTTHSIANPLVTSAEDDRADLLALVEAQHVVAADPIRHLLLKNIYRVDLRRDAAIWRMWRVVIENVWFDGDPGVLFNAPDR